MPWPKLWPSSTKDEPEKNISITERVAQQVEKAVNQVSSVTDSNASKLKSSTDTSPLRAFLEPQTVLATIILTAASLGLFKVYRSYLQRIPEATNIRPDFFRKRSIFGKVTSVGDGDNFRIYHTPGGWLAGWGWLPWRRVPKEKKDLKGQTIHLRMAGIDAPELAHFGRPSQPYAQEALDWLTAYVLGRRVRAYVYKADQYSRAVGTAYVWKGLIRRDIGLQMIRAGLATVYEAKTGSEFGEGLEEKYRKAEWWAKTKRKGMWAGDKKDFESPREYKKRYGMGNADDSISTSTSKKSWF